MLIVQIITMAVVALALLATYIIFKSKGIAITDTKRKIVSVLLAVAFFLRYMWDRDALLNIVALENSPIESTVLTAVALIANWALNSLVLLVILYPFFSNSKLSMLVKYYGTAVLLLYIVALSNNTIGLLGSDVYSQFNIRVLLLSVELGILLFTVGLEFYNSGFGCKVSNLWALVFIFGMLLAVMPSYMPSALFGYYPISYTIKDLSVAHRLIVYGAIILPLLIYLLLKGRDKATIRLILTYICVGGMITFSTYKRFTDLTTLSSWPLHLCNTAMYVLPLCLVFKLNKLFYFTYFINVLGAAAALLMPNYSDGLNIFAYQVLSFYINHYQAFFMPILFVALGMFERPNIKYFRYSMIAFCVYFVAVLVANAYCTNFNADVDFFFLNSDFIVSKLGDWAEHTRDIVWQFSVGELDFVFYPLYQAIFFLGYIVAGAGMWFLYEAMYSFEDGMWDIVRRKKAIRVDRLALEVSLAGRSVEEPMNIDTADKLILDNFSKRYGKSSNYAVKDANLEVCAGDIFGFLGHNGAGKSTIIKSIVGIQPITSGSISVCGYDVDKQSVNAKRCIGFVPDHYALYERLTGREYLNHIADMYGVDKAERDQTMQYYVQLFHLEGAIDNQIKTYSHGMKQKVTIMSALIHNPKLWILDEPLTGLDPDSIYQVKQCMKNHAAKGNIVFFSSHLIDIVETVCNKIAIIAQGNILTCDNVADVISKGSLEQHYRTVTEQATSAGMDMAGNLVEV